VDPLAEVLFVPVAVFVHVESSCNRFSRVIFMSFNLLSIRWRLASQRSVGFVFISRLSCFL
jgi:hypothetical protein